MRDIVRSEAVSYTSIRFPAIVWKPGMMTLVEKTPKRPEGWSSPYTVPESMPGAFNVSFRRFPSLFRIAPPRGPRM